jgi:hypothetical protein
MLDPFQFLVIAIAGWMTQRQQQAIEYLREENRVLREQLGDRRVRFNDDQRRRLAVRAKGLGRKLLAEIARLVTSNPGCNVALRLYVSAQHDRRYSAPVWNRTSASAKPKGQLEAVPNTTLGVDRGCGFLYGRGLDGHGVEALPRTILYRSVHP